MVQGTDVLGSGVEVQVLGFGLLWVLGIGLFWILKF